ncbi:hypothetical protein H7X65_00155 [Candidatus Parcubacteria bacterium]|nr:hypothetical protein [Candidatus Parcubacteria bacterium]
MTLGYTDGKTKIKIFLLIFGLVSISSFTVFELRKVISGPELTLNCIDDKNVDSNCAYIKSDNNIYKMSGRTKNVSDIIIGDRKIYIDIKGGFQEDILLYPGINLITIKSLDRFGKEVKKEVSIYYSGKLTMAK